MVVTFFLVVGTAIHDGLVVVLNRVVVLQLNTIETEFGLQVLVKLLEVDTFAERTVMSRIEYAVYHLIDKCLLVAVAASHDFLQGAYAVGMCSDVSFRKELIRHRCLGRSLERGEHASVFCPDLMGALDDRRVVAYSNGIDSRRYSRHRLRTLFQVSACFVNLQLMSHLSEASLHVLLEVDATHIQNLADVADLQSEQTEKRDSHRYCQ